MKTDLAQCLEDASRLPKLETALIEDIVAVGDIGGEGAHGGFVRNLVAFVAELAFESAGDNGLSRSYDFFNVGLCGELTFNEVFGTVGFDGWRREFVLSNVGAALVLIGDAFVVLGDLGIGCFFLPRRLISCICSRSVSTVGVVM